VQFVHGLRCVLGGGIWDHRSPDAPAIPRVNETISTCFAGLIIGLFSSQCNLSKARFSTPPSSTIRRTREIGAANIIGTIPARILLGPCVRALLAASFLHPDHSHRIWSSPPAWPAATVRAAKIVGPGVAADLTCVSWPARRRPAGMIASRAVAWPHQANLAAGYGRYRILVCLYGAAESAADHPGCDPGSSASAPLAAFCIRARPATMRSVLVAARNYFRVRFSQARDGWPHRFPDRKVLTWGRIDRAWDLAACRFSAAPIRVFHALLFGHLGECMHRTFRRINLGLRGTL